LSGLADGIRFIDGTGLKANAAFGNNGHNHHLFILCLLDVRIRIRTPLQDAWLSACFQFANEI
jgi:hypothetical protein